MTKEQLVRLIGYILAASGGSEVSYLAIQYSDYKIVLAALMIGIGGLIFGADDGQ